MRRGIGYLTEKIDRQKRQEYLIKLYDLTAKIAIKYGAPGDKFCHYDENYIREFWTDGLQSMPSLREIRQKVNVGKLKTYIHDFITVKEPIWNSDFIHGVTRSGKVLSRKSDFDTFVWYNNYQLFDLIEKNPFGGRTSHPIYKLWKWKKAPVLSTKYDPTSFSYFAGLLATGRLVSKDNYTYAYYSASATRCLREWKIPVEKLKRRGRDEGYISPFWPALFSFKMPDDIAQKWISAKNPFNADLYSVILWKVYVDNNFPTDGIPFLPCRRKIYYDYKCEEGAMKKVEMLRVRCNLVELPNTIRDAVREWAKKHYEKKESKNEILVD